MREVPPDVPETRFGAGTLHNRIGVSARSLNREARPIRLVSYRGNDVARDLARAGLEPGHASGRGAADGGTISATGCPKRVTSTGFRVWRTPSGVERHVA